MTNETVEQHASSRKRARAAARPRSRGAKLPPSPLRRANAEAVVRLCRQESYVLDAELLELWEAHSGLERQEILTAIDDLALAGRVSIQVGRYGERKIGLTDPMREFQAAGCDIGEVPA